MAESLWQRESPEEDGWYVVVDNDGRLDVAERGTTTSGIRYVAMRGIYRVVGDPAQRWLLPAIPPHPEETK